MLHVFVLDDCCCCWRCWECVVVSFLLKLFIASSCFWRSRAFSMLALRSLRDLRIFLFLKSPPPRVNGPAASQAGGGGREVVGGKRWSYCCGAERQTETTTATVAAGPQNANTGEKMRRINKLWNLIKRNQMDKSAVKIFLMVQTLRRAAKPEQMPSEMGRLSAP